jgi:hypothetical protein
MLLNQGQRRRVVKVPPLATNGLMRSGEQGDRFAPAIAPRLSSAYPPLGRL